MVVSDIGEELGIPPSTLSGSVRVTADTNIYISALNFGGMPERLLRLAEAGAIQLVASEAILTEVAKVLRGDKFAWPEPEIDRAMRQLNRSGVRRVEKKRSKDKSARPFPERQFTFPLLLALRRAREVMVATRARPEGIQRNARWWTPTRINS